MAYLVKGAPFKYNGAVNVEDCATAAEVIEKAQLDWTVDKCELVAKIPLLNSLRKDEATKGFIHSSDLYVECPNAYGVYRTDYNIPLGVVKERYTPVQNIDAFKFFDDAIGKDSAIWQTAGYFGNGERIFVSAKLPDYIVVNGDAVENYLVFTTSHDGSTGVKILLTPIRIVCQNTLNAAIANADSYVSFRHTSSVHENIMYAKEILGICNKNIQFLNTQFNIMNKIKVSDNQAADYFTRLILNDSEYQALGNTGHNPMQVIYKDYDTMCDANISTKKVNVISSMYDYYHMGVGQKEILGTGWGLYNAVSGYYSNVDNVTGTKRMDSLLYGDKSRKIGLAGNLILNIAKGA